ncbi:MAG: excinuclease ABC subunit B [Flavobacterium sp.]|uniref:excinuclease ABC subunit B n=1 Tax=Flavobacterium sp. TaxID=239 RepID=UPI00120047B8|nr:excinuclease ABC subunit B [Flavobacterium sp.]RZJ67413.1 MAG: excinuclease ABC subunit B [Flavobacterium sp.]
MNTVEEKLKLLLDMIAFSVIDGKLDPREYQFLALIASELRIDKESFDELFHTEQRAHIIRSESERIHQFYRLALLMHIDGVLDEREENGIFQIAIEMGLNPSATRRILQLMERSEFKILDPSLIFQMFREQQN